MSEENAPIGPVLTQVILSAAAQALEDSDPETHWGSIIVSDDDDDVELPALDTDEELDASHDRWSQRHGAYWPSSKTTARLRPGVYDIGQATEGIYFLPVGKRSDDLLRFPDSKIDEVVEQITTFWNREAIFRRYELPFRRGILLYGPPGSGKSSTVRIVGDDVVRRGGVVFLFQRPDLFIAGYRLFRRIQPDTPVVVVMEDLDATFRRYNESEILNMLDGVESVDKTVYLATTNYLEELSPRVTNRPSRFDRRYKIPHPADAARKMYLESLLRDGDEIPDIDKWVKDSNGLSLAHLKEMFVGVVILGDPYKEVVDAMNAMREKDSSVDDEEEFRPIRRGQYS